MKKLFAILMVLCLCGTASAIIVPTVTVSLEGEGTTIIAAPGPVTVNVLATPEAGGNPGLMGLDAVVTVTGGDVITDALKSAEAAGYGWDPTMPFDPLGLGTAVVEIGGVHFTVANSGVVGYVVVNYTGGPTPQVLSIANGAGFGGSFEVDGMTTPHFSTGVVTIIPEPVAIVLLGLGGLVLLRRQK